MADLSNAARPAAAPAEDLWQRALDGDRDAYEQSIEPYRDLLIDAARRKLAVRVAAGELAADALTPEELAGETLIRAFDGRHHFDPEQLSFRAWLLGVQLRTLKRVARDENRYTDQKAISLNDEVPDGDRQDAVEEDFYEFRQPFDVTTYDEIIPSQQPEDVEIDPRGRSLNQDELDYLEASGLSADHRQIVEFHDEFELTLPEIAQIMEYSLQDTAEAINEARVHLRQHIGSTDVDDVAEDDPIDSYTGEPISENPNQPDTGPADTDAATASDHDTDDRV